MECNTTSNIVIVIISSSNHAGPFPIIKDQQSNLHFTVVQTLQITGLDSLTKRRQGDRTDDRSIMSRNWAIENGLVVDGQRAKKWPK